MTKIEIELTDYELQEIAKADNWSLKMPNPRHSAYNKLIDAAKTTLPPNPVELAVDQVWRSKFKFGDLRTIICLRYDRVYYILNGNKEAYSLKVEDFRSANWTLVQKEIEEVTYTPKIWDYFTSPMYTGILYKCISVHDHGISGQRTHDSVVHFFGLGHKFIKAEAPKYIPKVHEKFKVNHGSLTWICYLVSNDRIYAYREYDPRYTGTFTIYREVFIKED